jgi:hypothetical protein
MIVPVDYVTVPSNNMIVPSGYMCKGKAPRVYRRLMFFFLPIQIDMTKRSKRTGGRKARSRTKARTSGRRRIGGRSRTGKRKSGGKKHGSRKGSQRQPRPPSSERRNSKTFNRRQRLRISDPFSTTPLPPIRKFSRDSSGDDFWKRGSVVELHGRKNDPQFRYPSREDRYTPWEKIKYAFVKDERPYPPTLPIERFRRGSRGR